MDISQALSIITPALRDYKVIETAHYKEKCEDRNLDVSSIKKTLKSGIKGIVEQDKGLYKIWFAHSENKDLNIILTLQQDKKVRLITIFVSRSERRLR